MPSEEAMERAAKIVSRIINQISVSGNPSENDSISLIATALDAARDEALKEGRNRGIEEAADQADRTMSDIGEERCTAMAAEEIAWAIRSLKSPTGQREG
jgi:N-acetylglutamate synthase/N-acetylornithine aminotransferase